MATERRPAFLKDAYNFTYLQFLVTNQCYQSVLVPVCIRMSQKLE